MLEAGLDDAREALEGLLDVLRGAGGVVSAEQVKTAHLIRRLAEQVLVEAIGGLRRGGEIEASGYQKKPAAAIADLTGEDFPRARRLLEVADAVCRTEEQPAQLPQTAARFAARQADIEHVAVVAGLLSSADAGRLSVEVWQHAEARLAALATGCTLRELRAQGQRILAELAPPGPEREAKPNELHLTRLPGGGGKIVARIGDSADFDLVETVLGALSAPQTAEDKRPQAQRLADALMEVCWFVNTHGANPDLPTGGNRPQVVVHAQLTDLQEGLRKVRSDNGVPLDPAAARALACDCEVIPMVLGTPTVPLDVGHNSRIVPPSIRHAVRVRDGGCAHPGCDRTPSWCEAHHITMPLSYGDQGSGQAA
jgi:hypothetical protein